MWPRSRTPHQVRWRTTTPVQLAIQDSYVSCLLCDGILLWALRPATVFTGAVACQICDAVFPGSVPMSKVKWDARNDYEFVHNYKILQRVFEKKVGAPVGFGPGRSHATATRTPNVSSHHILLSFLWFRAWTSTLMCRSSFGRSTRTTSSSCSG